MVALTHVVELKDLYSLVPTCRTLEHQNFSNIKELLTTLIYTVEKQKGWEFVQYITNKPSLFIVRYRPDHSKVEPIEAPKPVDYNKYETEVIESSEATEEEDYIVDSTIAIVSNNDKLPWE